MKIKSRKSTARSIAGRTKAPLAPATDWSFCDYYVPDEQLVVAAKSKRRA